MPWFRLDDKFHSHPKTVALFDGPCPGDALGLWTLAGSWCADQRTDGFVPSGQVKRFGLKPKAADELVRVGLWEVAEGGYRFHDYLDRNPSRKQLDDEREKSNARVTAHREKRKRECNGVTATDVTRHVTPAPSQSHPNPEEKRKEGERASARESPPPPEFEPSENYVPKPELWLQMHRRFGEIVHKGMPYGSPSSTRRHFEALAEACKARSPQDPIGLFVAVLSRYAARKAEKGHVPEPQYFERDFAAIADAKVTVNGTRIKPPIVLELERAKAQYAAAQKAGDLQSQARLADQLRSIGKRMSGHA